MWVWWQYALLTGGSILALFGIAAALFPLRWLSWRLWDDPR